jgi:hypothetical protein
MTNPKEQKKFEARIAQDLWDEYEAWVGARVSVTNTQLLSGLLRLFLLAPEDVKLRTILGRPEDLVGVFAVPSTPEIADAIVAEAQRARVPQPTRGHRRSSASG